MRRAESDQSRRRFGSCHRAQALEPVSALGQGKHSLQASMAAQAQRSMARRTCLGCRGSGCGLVVMPCATHRGQNQSPCVGIEYGGTRSRAACDTVYRVRPWGSRAGTSYSAQPGLASDADPIPLAPSPTHCSPRAARSGRSRRGGRRSCSRRSTAGPRPPCTCSRRPCAHPPPVQARMAKGNNS